MIHSKTGVTQYQAYGMEKECNYSVSRTALNNFLIDEAERNGVKLFFNHSLKSIDFKNRKLEFLNSQANYDLLFGADGAGSMVRHELVKSWGEPDLEKVEWLEADYKELNMPAAEGGAHRMEKNALHIWPRGSHMLMGLANGDGSFTMTLYLKKTGPLSFSEVKTKKEIQHLFESEFKDAIPLLPHYIEDFETNPQGTLGTVRCKRWAEGHSVCLIGDAAHAIIPFFGQGMNCGFEDCSVLLDLMDKFGDQWNKILPAFEAERLPNADAIADMALENWSEMKDKVADQNFLLRKKVEGWLEKQFPKHYKSRYGMVTYTLIPYALAQRAGVVQDGILKVLCHGISSPEEISKDQAWGLIEREFLPFLKNNNISLN
jgi:kynurenine 3-monooxygenase